MHTQEVLKIVHDLLGGIFVSTSELTVGSKNPRNDGECRVLQHASSGVCLRAAVAKS